MESLRAAFKYAIKKICRPINPLICLSDFISMYLKKNCLGATNAECSEAGGEGVNISSIDSEESIKVKDNSCGEKSDETNDTLEANKICKSEEAPEVEIKPESSQSKVGSEKMADENLIHIKLKYLNDDIKHVEGLKGEKLGEFKR